jgi:hypothetical protein
MMKNVPIERRQYAILALGVSLCLIGALLMVAGQSILGERHTGIASLIGIIGICIIGSFDTSLKRTKAERRKA